MLSRSFLSDILRRVSSMPWSVDSDSSIADACRTLIEERSEAAGLVLARDILDRFEAAAAADQAAFFEQVADRFGADETSLSQAISDWRAGDADATRRLHYAAEPSSLALLRTLNRVPGATARLVRMREKLLGNLQQAPGLSGLDNDFQHVFSSWFNRGFLELRRIDWSTPAAVLEKIIEYEAVHEIAGWDDLRQRVADPDRRLFGFFHPAMGDEPLIFVEIALMKRIPASIGAIIAAERESLDPVDAKVAVFYSISNCHAGLKGISFGNFLIKQVVANLNDELPGLTTYVTLSPVPGLRRYVDSAERNHELLGDIAGTDGSPPGKEAARKLAARYLTGAKRSNGWAHDPVANFHLSNGAELYDIHAEADPSPVGLQNAWGVMVNYRYDPARTEANHRAYVREGEVIVSSKVRSLVRK